ncbi:LysR family transcriptional regulator [Lentilactobacillus buchneri]|uniref:LysR family transcriptional regulator n=1 Tax=Lentilactobacillus buchneri TaxID=1581 RepID=UPI001193019C|nr:LysR family transcriptional regulator [Lentilactobacillus buchneri]QUX04599.1 LysR family transcriptional regulator [Lentilactobacillus buchneri]GEP14840.1 LysR family transcriptional regulator [Lentilactobacillus buchneri]
MNINDLKYYVSLSTEKNFSRVAQDYSVSQPTISAAIKRLEAAFGSRLLVRGNPHQAITLTTAGEQLLVHANEILYHYRLAVREIENSHRQQLVIGMPPIIETNYFPMVAKQLPVSDLNHIQTVEEGSLSALRDLKSGQLDVSFLGYVDDVTDSELIVDEFDQQHFSILVAKDSPLAKLTEVSFNQLKNESFILFKNNFVHDRVFHTLAQQNHIRPQVIFRSSEAQSIVNMVADGIGVSLLTQAVKVNNPNVVALRLTDEAQPVFKIGLAYRQSTVFVNDQQHILTMIRDALGL